MDSLIDALAPRRWLLYQEVATKALQLVTRPNTLRSAIDFFFTAPPGTTNQSPRFCRAVTR